MSRHRKYMKGKCLTTQEAVCAVLNGEYLIVHDRPMHPSWAISQQLATLNNSCRRNCVYESLITPEWQEKVMKEVFVW